MGLGANRVLTFVISGYHPSTITPIDFSQQSPFIPLPTLAGADPEPCWPRTAMVQGWYGAEGRREGLWGSFK